MVYEDTLLQTYLSHVDKEYNLDLWKDLAIDADKKNYNLYVETLENYNWNNRLKENAMCAYHYGTNMAITKPRWSIDNYPARSHRSRSFLDHNMGHKPQTFKCEKLGSSKPTTTFEILQTWFNQSNQTNQKTHILRRGFEGTCVKYM